MEKGLVKGSMTVEMSFLMPLILLMLMSSILAVFYFHDKNILAGAAYETAVVGSTKMREREKTDAEELAVLCKERIAGKCILFGASDIQVAVGEKEIIVEVSAQKGKFKVSVIKKAAVTAPEKFIRNMRRVKEIGDGAKNND